MALATRHICRQQLTIADTIIKLSASLTALTSTMREAGRFIYADIEVQTAAVRVTADGATDPVAGSVGQLWNPTQRMRIWGLHNLDNLWLLRNTTTSAVIVVECWGA